MLEITTSEADASRVHSGAAPHPERALVVPAATKPLAIARFRILTMIRSSTPIFLISALPPIVAILIFESMSEPFFRASADGQLETNATAAFAACLAHALILALATQASGNVKVRTPSSAMAVVPDLMDTAPVGPHARFWGEVLGALGASLMIHCCTLPLLGVAAALSLRHPRIVSVHEVGAMGPFPYFSMDYIEGSTLRAVVERRGFLSHEDAIAILVEICRAVAHAHSKGIIHRDLKPENVMIDAEGDVFVMDFGLARAVEDAGLTQEGTIMGTPFYMSPEQIAGEKLDERSDIFSIGLILHYCLTGEELFRADTMTAVIARHSTLQIREVVATESLPANLQDVLVSMMERERSMRARSVKEVLERLTLRRIVALGLAATEEPMVSENTPTVAQRPTEEDITIAAEDPRLAAGIERRKARLRSLLDTF